MLLSDNSASQQLLDALASYLLEAAKQFDTFSDRKSLFRPYVSGLFESGDADEFENVRAFLTAANCFPRWAAEVLSCWYVVDPRNPGYAIVSDYLLQGAFSATIIGSFCEGAFHLARLTKETHAVLRAVAHEVHHALSTSPFDWNTERTFAGLCVEGLISKRLHEFNSKHRKVLSKVKRRLMAEATRARAA